VSQPSTKSPLKNNPWRWRGLISILLIIAASIIIKLTLGRHTPLDSGGSQTTHIRAV